jgi:hypothetical protein
MALSKGGHQGYGAVREYRDDPNYGEYRDDNGISFKSYTALFRILHF